MHRPATQLFSLSLFAGWMIGLIPPTLAAATSTPVTLAVLGDSLGAGYGVEREQSFPSLLQQKADQSGFPVKFVNASVSGDTTAGGMRRIGWVLKRPVDILLIALGGNDGLRGVAPETTRANLQGIIDRARAKNPEIRIIIAGMRMPSNLGETYTRQFAEIFPDVAKKNGAELIPFLLEGVGGNPELNLSDRIHPNPRGHRILAENVWAVLKPVFEKMFAEKSES